MKKVVLAVLSIISTINFLAVHLIISGTFTRTSHAYYPCALVAAVILALDLFLIAKSHNTRLVKSILWGIVIISLYTFLLCNGAHSTAIMVGID